MARVKEMDVDDASRNMTDDLVKEMEQLTAHFRSDGAIERMQRCLSSLHEWKTQIDNHRQTLQREIHRFESDEERLKSGSQNADVQMAINSVTSLKQALSSEDQKVTQLTKELEMMDRQCSELTQSAQHAEQTKSQIDADLSRQLQTAKNQLSLFHCISGIVWHDSDPALYVGNVTASDRMDVFSLDSNSLTPFQLTNQLWSMFN